MTLPTQILFPNPADYTRDLTVSSLKRYIEELTYSLTDMYQDIAQNVNGAIKSWTPTVYGLSTPGTTITYTHQEGWVRRSGILTEVWFDVGWSAHDGTGDVAILMPYEAANASYHPWVGVLESDSATNAFGAGRTYVVIRCEPNTNQGSIICCGSAVASTGVAIQTSGRYSGHIQYLGKEIE